MFKKILYCAIIIVLFSFAVNNVEAAPPKNFKSENLTKIPDLPTDIEFSPDGRMFVLGKKGKGFIIKDGKRNSKEFISLKVSSESERGLLGIAFDPDFQNNRYVYLYYTTGKGSLKYKNAPKNRVSRFQMNANNPDIANIKSEKIILDNIASDAGHHNAGALKIGPDKKLYIATGDGGKNNKNSQNLANLSGKILRLNLDGTIPADNPFYRQKGRRGEIWVYGLRNPWKFAFNANGQIAIADVGLASYEEINIGKKGANYGWPNTEGPNPKKTKGVTYPAYHYASKGGAAIVGGEFYNGSQFPAKYKGDYFFGDFVKNFIRHVRFNAKGKVVWVKTFDKSAGWMTDIVFGPDGSMYYAVGDSGSAGHIQKISYTMQ